MASYATLADFANYGLAPAATVNVPDPRIQAELDAASSFADGCLGSRTGLPIQGPPYPTVLVQKVCEYAAFGVLKVRGFNPKAPNDQAILAGFDRAEQWFIDIREGKLVPTFIPVEPAIAVSSDPPRGWYDSSGKVQ